MHGKLLSVTNAVFVIMWDVKSRDEKKKKRAIPSRKKVEKSDAKLVIFNQGYIFLTDIYPGKTFKN